MQGDIQAFRTLQFKSKVLWQFRKRRQGRVEGEERERNVGQDSWDSGRQL